MTNTLAQAPTDQNHALYAGRLAGNWSPKAHWLDAGEYAAIMSVADQVRGGSILDIGIGGGRTTGLLTLLGGHYVGVDYSQPVVTRAAAAYPGVDIRLGDARQLPEDLPGAPYDLVFFSNLGIDSLSHEERQLALAEARRVLRPGGYFVYATFNRTGPHFDPRPWQPAPDPSQRVPERLARWVSSIVLRPKYHPRRYYWYFKLRPRRQDFGDWAITPLVGSGAGLMVHWITPGAIQRELTDAGLDLLRLYEEEGQPILPSERGERTPWIHVVAQRPLA